MRKALMFAAIAGLFVFPALAQSPARSNHPDGSGDPDATTCRPPQPLPSSHFSGPQVCKLNSQWALLRKNGEDISADGRSIIPDPKGSNVGPMRCNMVGGGATSSGQMVCQAQ
jgi:hypothetical protein